jgi:putative zinc- or iron-chelating protein
MNDRSWSRSADRRILLRVYADADRALAPFSCEASADCCHFARTGREPSVTVGEWLEIVRAVRASGRKLPPPPGDDERTCPFLSGARCSIYESRPLGCRTYFCDRISGPGRPPRDALGALVPDLRRVAERVDPRDPKPRTLSSWLRGG